MPIPCVAASFSHTHMHVPCCIHIMCYFGSFPWPLTLAPERCKCPKNIMAPFLCKNKAVKEDNWGCHDNRVQKADGAVFARGTSNGIKAPPGPVHQLWFELGSDFHSLSSNSRSIWSTPFRKGEKGEKGPARPGPDGPRDLDFIRDNYLICFISMLPQGLAGGPVGSLQFEKACSQPEACGSGH